MSAWLYVSIGLSVISTIQGIKAAKEAKKLAKKTTNQGIELTRYGQDQQIPVVLGRRKLAPAIVYRGTQENPYADNELPNERYYAALVWCVGEVEEIEEIYFDDRPLSDFGFSQVFFGNSYNFATTSVNGERGNPVHTYTIPSAETFFAAGKSGAIEHRLGKNENQVPSWFKAQVEDDLAGMEFRDLCVTFVFLEMDAEFKRFPNGEPEFSAIVKGKKIPNLANANTVEYTDNFASQVHWYALDTQVGMGLKPSEAEVFTQSFVDMATFGNTQDPVYTDNTHTTIDHYEPRLRSNFIIDTSQTYFDNLEKWFKDFDATFIDSNEGFKLDVARERNAVMHIDELDVIGEVSVSTKPIDERFNQVTVRFENEEIDFVSDELSYPETDSALHLTLLAEDGDRPLNEEVELNAITSPYHALQYAEMLLNKSRQGLTVELAIGAKGLQLEEMDVITYTDSKRGFSQKEFEVRGIAYEGLKVSLTLVEYQASNYAWSDKSIYEATPDTTLPDPFTLIAPTGLAVNYLNGQYEFTWNEVSSFKTNYYIELIDSNGNRIVKQKAYSNKISLPIFQTGQYSFLVYTQNQTSLSTPTQLTFDTNTPSVPTVTYDVDAISMVIVASYQGQYFDVTFEAKYSLTNDIESATDLGLGSNWKIVGLSPSTEIFVWVRTIGLTGNSDWLAFSGQTDAQAANIAQAVSGLIDIPNLATAAQDTISQIQADIVTNTNANAATDLALQVTNSNLSTIEYSLGDTFTDAFNVINDNITFREELLGTKAQVEALDGQITANATAITQSATKIELESVEVQLRGEIQNILTGDIDAILEGAIGDLQGEVTQVKFFIGEDNLDGQQTITSFVNNIVLGQDFVTINQVQQEIDSGGITGIVTQAAFNSTTTTLNNNIERLGNNVRTEYLSSFAFMTDQNTSINAALVEAQLKSYNAQLALAEDSESFEGSISSIKNEQTVLSDEVSAQAQSVNEQIARIDNNISITNTTLNNLSTRTESIASIQTELKAQVDDGLGAVVLRLDQAESDIQGNANAVSLVQGKVDDPDTGLTASYQLAQAAQTTANGAVSSVTTLQNNLNTVSGTANSALELATTANTAAGELAAEAFLSVDVNNRIAGVKLSASDQNPSVVDIIANTFKLTGIDGQGQSFTVMDWNTSNNTMNFPAGTLTLTAQQQEDLKGASGATITNTATTTLGNGDTQVTVSYSDGTTSVFIAPKGSSGASGAGYYAYNDNGLSGFPTTSEANSRFFLASGRNPTLGDHLNINSTGANPFSTTKRFDGSQWVAPTLKIDGDLLVEGAISGNSGQFPATQSANAYVLRINQDPNYPLWYGKFGDSITRANAKFFVDKDGEVSKPVSQSIGYSDGTLVSAPFPAGVVYEQEVYTVTQHKRYGNPVKVEFSVDAYFPNDGQNTSGTVSYKLEIYKQGVYSDTLISSKNYTERYGLTAFQSFSIRRMLLATDTSGASPNNDDYYYGVFTITNDSGNMWQYQDFNSSAVYLKLMTTEITQ